MKKLLLFFFVIQMFGKSFADSYGGEGGQETNGGDGIVADYLKAFDDILERLPEHIQLDGEQYVAKSHLQNVRKETQFSSVEKIFLADREVSAINEIKNSVKRLVISRSSWATLSPEARTILVLHEQLTLSGYYDGDYVNSSIVYRRSITPQKIEGRLLGSSILGCRRDFLKTISKSDFENSFDESIRSEYLYLASAAGCLSFLKMWKEWGYSVNQCDLATPLAFVLNSNAMNFETRKEAIEILISAGAQTSYSCERLNSHCNLITRFSGDEYFYWAFKFQCNH